MIVDQHLSQQVGRILGTGSTTYPEIDFYCVKVYQFTFWYLSTDWHFELSNLFATLDI